MMISSDMRATAAAGLLAGILLASGSASAATTTLCTDLPTYGDWVLQESCAFGDKIFTSFESRIPIPSATKLTFSRVGDEYSLIFSSAGSDPLSGGVAYSVSVEDPAKRISEIRMRGVPNTPDDNAGGATKGVLVTLPPVPRGTVPVASLVIGRAPEALGGLTDFALLDSRFIFVVEQFFAEAFGKIGNGFTEIANVIVQSDAPVPIPSTLALLAPVAALMLRRSRCDA